jgi:hypothetical protein
LLSNQPSTGFIQEALAPTSLAPWLYNEQAQTDTTNSDRHRSGIVEAAVHCKGESVMLHSFLAPRRLAKANV